MVAFTANENSRIFLRSPKSGNERLVSGWMKKMKASAGVTGRPGNVILQRQQRRWCNGACTILSMGVFLTFSEEPTGSEFWGYHTQESFEVSHVPIAIKKCCASVIIKNV